MYGRRGRGNVPPRGRHGPQLGQPRQQHHSARPQPIQPQQQKSFCGVGDCRFESTSCEEYKNHLKTTHVDRDRTTYDQFRETLSDYAIRYFHIDAQSFRQRFMHACELCKKHSNQPQTQQIAETTLAEDLLHINDHYSVPEYYCTMCSVWLISLADSKKHASQTHRGRHKPILGRIYLTQYPATLEMYNHLVNQLKAGRTTSTKKAERINRVVGELPETDTTEVDLDLFMVIVRNENDWHSLKDFEGRHVDVFKTCGDMRFMGKLIVSSPANEVEKCCSEMAQPAILLELLCHRRASYSLCSLLVKSTDQFFASFVSVVESSRRQIFDNVYAAHAMRRLLTNAPIEVKRHLRLSQALLTANQIGQLENSPYRGYFLSGIASRNGAPSQTLALFLCPKLVEYATSKSTHELCRILVSTASTHPQQPAYVSFFNAAKDAIFSIADDKYGCYVAQCLIFYATEIFNNILWTLVSVDWIFKVLPTGFARYQTPNQNHFVQTVLTKSPSAANTLVVALNSNLERTKELFLHPVGNNIIRRLAAMLRDAGFLLDLERSLKNIKRQNSQQMRAFSEHCLKEVVDRRLLAADFMRNRHSMN